MLKQTFDKQQLLKVLVPDDISRWKLLQVHGSVDAAIKHTVDYWQRSNLQLRPLKKSVAKKKNIYCSPIFEDSVAIRLLDRFIRRVYKVRQSDRNRIIKQLKILLKDSGDYHIYRVDIKECYESINFEKIISKLQNDLILSPECIRLLNCIHRDLKDKHNLDGLPRGLPISPTLAELHLEQLDKKIASHPSVIYSARYVDDIVIFFPSNIKDKVKEDIKTYFDELELRINCDTDKKHFENTKNANFNFLGYCFAVKQKNNAPNEVRITISKPKINKIKTRIVECLIDNIKSKNLRLLKRRLEYLSMLKIVKKSKNGDLLAGIAHNYQLVSDDYKCTRSLDGFLFKQLNNARFGLSPAEIQRLKQISFYSNIRKQKVGNFTKTKTTQIIQVWNNV